MGERPSPNNGGQVPSIAELRPIAQGVKVSGDRRWTYRAFRQVSIYITWLLLHTGVTPNQVTVASLITAGAGLGLVAFGSPWVALVGYLLLFVYHLLDRVDGEIARFRKIYSLRGIYLDNAGHYLTGAGIFIATTYRLAPDSSNPQVIWLIGTIGAVAAMMARVEKHASFQLFSQYVLEKPNLLQSPSVTAGALTRSATRDDRATGSTGHRRSLLTMTRDAALTLTSFPIVAAAFTIGLAIGIGADSDGVSIAILVIASAIQVVTYLALEAVNLTQNLFAESERLAETAQKAYDSAAEEQEGAADA